MTRHRLVHSQTAERTNINIVGDEYRVHEDKKVKLKDWPTDGRPIYGSKKEYQELLAQRRL